jgi:hypothetical protein
MSDSHLSEEVAEFLRCGREHRRVIIILVDGEVDEFQETTEIDPLPGTPTVGI